MLALKRLLPTASRKSDPAIANRTVCALASLLLLVQLPHTLHLPLWVSLLGISLVVARLAMVRNPAHAVLSRILSPVCVTAIAALSAFALRWDFGYFIGRDPSVAFLFILVAAKFAEVRRNSDATLLLCLAAFLLLTQYFYSQSIVAAAVTIPAVIALAFALSVLRDSDNPTTIATQLRMIGKLLVQGLPLAGLLFLVFPRLPGPLWSLPEDAAASTGLSGSMSPGSIGSLSQSDAVAFRVEFDSAPPPKHLRYWRGPVLTEFDGRSWQESQLNLEATRHYQGSAANLTNYTVMLQPHRQRWLFALDAAVGLPQKRLVAQSAEKTSAINHNTRHGGNSIGRFYSDGQIKAKKPVNTVIRYQQSSVLTGSTTPKRRPLNNTLFLPGKNTRTIEYANTLYRKHANDKDYAKAILAQFNQQGFSYTLQPQLLGDKPIDEFLFDTKAGFCEHYAAAFVVMMRAVGIPARVVTGYLGGEMNADYMIVRQSDAHAWAEAFIDNQWQRFDPTGAVAPARIEQGIASALPDTSHLSGLSRHGNSWLRQARLRWDAVNHQWQRLVVGYDDDSQQKLWEKLGLPKPELWQITLVILLVAAAWSVIFLGLPQRSQGSLTKEERYWQRLCRLLSARGLSRRKQESAQEYLTRAGTTWPQHLERLEDLQKNFSALRFAPRNQTDVSPSLRQIRHDLQFLWWTLRRCKSSDHQ